ncbi:MAG TPA: DUF885 domain-containing protein [Planctomycetaceae bacterium]|nr:DUF885 domain-containing protein [Planctomycetaceae bacterium]
MSWPVLVALSVFWIAADRPEDAAMDQAFEELGRRYVSEFPELSPVGATQLGDHRFDGRLDEISPAARERQRAFCRKFQEGLAAISPDKLSRAHQVDFALLDHALRAELWRLERLQEWSWNPLHYTELAGNAVYHLMARDFAPLVERLDHAAERLEQFPRLLRQVRETLDIKRVPPEHAETAVKQNRGVVSILENTVEPHVGLLSKEKRVRLTQALATARSAIETHQSWLENELAPKAAGDFRLGKRLFDEKLAFTLQTALERDEIRDRARRELERVRGEMYKTAQEVYRRKHPHTRFPDAPSREYAQAIIRAALEIAARDVPPADKIVETAKSSLATATEFVRKHDLITLPDDPLEIIIMPEFQRGVSTAYCDSPGPLDVGQKTFYAVAPLPADWTSQQIESFLREYNVRSIHNLTIHEAMPGHFVQLAWANRYPSTLRAVLSSGVFIEGWACYVERMMVDEGYLGGDPLMRLVSLKWYLRTIANALLDQAIHVEGLGREDAMQLMIEDTFQEEREAAGKWTRAQLTSTQLSTYFVGLQEHLDLRSEAQAAWGGDFDLKRYHDKVVSFGSPPVKFVRALLLNCEIPAR